MRLDDSNRAETIKAMQIHINRAIIFDILGNLWQYIGFL
jgi:hypothetical protein